MFSEDRGRYGVAPVVDFADAYAEWQAMLGSGLDRMTAGMVSK